MFRPTLANPAQKRTLRPIYAQHQATPHAGFLDPSWDKSFDILPGTVMARTTDEVFTPYTGAAGQRPYGLSALFCAPTLGIDEVTSTGTNLFTVWIGGDQAFFEVLAPAFDTTASWVAPTNGSIQLLKANSTGKLTPVGVNHGNAIAELISVLDTGKILIRLNRFNLGVTTPVGAS
jgi:hypothetical protein